MGYASRTYDPSATSQDTKDPSRKYSVSSWIRLLVAAGRQLGEAEQPLGRDDHADAAVTWPPERQSEDEDPLERPEQATALERVGGMAPSAAGVDRAGGLEHQPDQHVAGGELDAEGADHEQEAVGRHAAERGQRSPSRASDPSGPAAVGARPEHATARGRARRRRAPAAATRRPRGGRSPRSPSSPHASTTTAMTSSATTSRPEVRPAEQPDARARPARPRISGRKRVRRTECVRSVTAKPISRIPSQLIASTPLTALAPGRRQPAGRRSRPHGSAATPPTG